MELQEKENNYQYIMRMNNMENDKNYKEEEYVK